MSRALPSRGALGREKICMPNSVDCPPSLGVEDVREAPHQLPHQSTPRRLVDVYRRNSRAARAHELLGGESRGVLTKQRERMRETNPLT